MDNLYTIVSLLNYDVRLSCIELICTIFQYIIMIEECSYVCNLILTCAFNCSFLHIK